MAIDFPNSPTTGDTYTAGGRTWQWDGTVWASYGNYPDPTVLKIDTGTNRVGINNTSPTTALDVTGDLTVSGTITGGSISGAGMTVSSTAPSSPSAGEMWYNDTTGRTFVYYDDGSSQQWVEFGVPPEGSTIALASYADSAARTTAIPSPTEADLSYLQDTNSVEVYDGSAWTAVGGSGAVTLVATATPTAVTSVSIDNCFTSTYQNYLVVVKTGDPATNQTVTLRLRASSTDDSTSNYFRLNHGVNAGGEVTVTGTTTSFFLGYAGNTSELAVAFNVFAPEQAVRTSISGEAISNNSAFNAITGWSIGGWFNATTQFDGFTILFGANTTGVVRVYGVANS